MQCYSCKSVTFEDIADLRIIWFDDEKDRGTCRVECFWRDDLIWLHRYKRQETFQATVKKYTERAKQITLTIRAQEATPAGHGNELES